MASDEPSGTSSEGDAPTQADFAHRADALLRSMEPRFLEILAENAPKGDGGSAASSAGGSTAGNPAEFVRVTVQWDRDALSRRMDEWIRWSMFGDVEAMASMMGLMETLIMQGVELAEVRRWYEGEEGL